MRQIRLAGRAIVMAVALVASGAAAAGPVQLVVLGDSLSAGYGLAVEAGFPARLQAALVARGHDVEVLDAGVSGDTTRAGAERIDWSVGPDADAVIVELGANDALRGIAPAETRAALERILARLKERQLPVLLAGMLAPPNLGPEYGAAFNAMYADLARLYGAELYPFFLDGVTGVPDLLLADGMHPNAAGIDAMVSRILPVVERLLSRVNPGG